MRSTTEDGDDALRRRVRYDTQSELCCTTESPRSVRNQKNFKNQIQSKIILQSLQNSPDRRGMMFRRWTTSTDHCVSTDHIPLLPLLKVFSTNSVILTESGSQIAPFCPLRRVQFRVIGSLVSRLMLPSPKSLNG